MSTLLLAGVFTMGTSCATSPTPAATLANEYYNLGNAWFDLKKFDQAARAYQNALGWNPDLKIATLNLARTKAELGDAAGALALLDPLIQGEGADNLELAQYRAWLTAKLKGLAAAADQYSTLAQRLPGDATTQFNAGLTLAAAGKTDQALVALRTWKSLDGKSPVGLMALAQVLDKSSPAEAAQAWLDAAQVYPDGDQQRFKPLFARALSLDAAQLYGDEVAAWNTVLALPSSTPTPAGTASTPNQGSTPVPPGSPTTLPPGTPPTSSPTAPDTGAVPVAPSSVPAAPAHTRAEAQFLRGRVLLFRIEDYDAGSQGLIDAWKAGFRDPKVWKALMDSPLLKDGIRLQADLKLAGVTL